MRLEPLVRVMVDTLSDTEVGIGVVEINIGQDVSQERFGALESIFQCFDILRGRIASSIRWLVIRAICVKDSSALCI